MLPNYTHISRILLLATLALFLSNCATVSKAPSTSSSPADVVEVPSLPPYHGARQRIMVFPWNISKVDLEKYPYLQQQRVGFGLSNRLLDILYDSGRFELVEEKNQVIQRMTQQLKQCADGNCDPASSINALALKTADYIVYPEVYHFGVDRVVDLSGVSSLQQETTELGVQINFVNAKSGVTEALGSFIGHFDRSAEGSILNELERLPFSQSILGKVADQAITGALAKTLTRLQPGPQTMMAQAPAVEIPKPKTVVVIQKPEPVPQTIEASPPPASVVVTKKRETEPIVINIASNTKGNTNNTETKTTSSSSASLQSTGKFYALIIGNNDYKFVGKLKTARADAESIDKVLREDYGYQTELILDASRQIIIERLDNLRRTLNENDNLLIYYAGHGFYDDASERGYWLPVNASEDNTAEWISNTDITDKIKALKSKHVLVVADSCFSGTLTREANVDLDRENDKSLYYQRMQNKRSRTALASGGIEPVSDLGGGSGHSVFAKAFMDTLKDNTAIMDGSEFANKVRQRVILNAKQTPEYSDIRFAGHEGGDFLLIKTRK